MILAGGTGSRLMPLTRVINKHCLPVGREPMICHPVRKLVEAGITEIMVVTGTEHMGAVVGLLGSGKDYGAEFTYRVQDQAGGIAQALGLARGFPDDGKLCVLLGDNIFEDSLSPHVEEFRLQGRCTARILLKVVADPQRYGVPVFLHPRRMLMIEEKPAAPKSRYAVTGIYFYDEAVFKHIEGLKPSARGELEITEVNNEYIAYDNMEWDTLTGWWTDAGTHESLRMANLLVNGESK